MASSRDRPGEAQSRPTVDAMNTINLVERVSGAHHKSSCLL